MTTIKNQHQTPQELLAGYDADILAHPKRSTRDLEIELLLIKNAMIDEIEKKVDLVKLKLLSKSGWHSADTQFIMNMETYARRMDKLHTMPNLRGRPRISR